MTLSRIFRKPNWQHRDPEIRAQSVALDQDPALAAALPTIALEDENERVRLAALARLDDFPLDLRLAREDPSAAINNTCWKRVRPKLAGQSGEDELGLDERRKLLARLDDDESLRYVAMHGKEAELRELAAQRLDEPALWYEIAQADHDSELRLQAAEQVHDRKLLERLARKSRHSDKALYHLVQARLDTLSGRRADPEYARARATELCQLMEALVTRPQRARAEHYRDIDGQWQTLVLQVPSALQQRYTRAAKVVGLATGALERPPMTTPVQPPDPLPEPTPRDDDRPADPRLQELLHAVHSLAPITGEGSAFRKMEARINAMHGRCDITRKANRLLLDEIEHAFKQARQQRHHAQEARQRELHTLEEHCAEIEQALEAKQLLAAVQAMDRAQTLRKHLGKVPDNILQRLNRIARALAELRSWQRWADNEARGKLCEQAEHLIEARPHPDALITLVRKLKQQWQEMDQREAATEPSGQASGGHLRGRFFHAIDAVMRPARPYFQRRDELREQHSESLQALCEQLKQAASGALKLDWKSMEKLLRRGYAGLRELAKVRPAERKRIAAQLKAATHALSGRLADHHKSVIRLKQKLLFEAEQIKTIDEPVRAARLASTLLQDWKAAGQAGHKEDQALWNEFRPLLDGGFQRADAERSAANQARNAALETLKDLCKQVESLVTDAGKSGDRLDETTLHRCQGQWDAVKSQCPPALKQRFATAVEGTRTRLQEQRRAARKAELKDLFARSMTPLASQASSDDHAEVAGQLVIRMEIAADLESPENCQAARMNIKVDALARQMQERSTGASPFEQAEQLILEWCQLCPLDPATIEALAPRAETAVQRLLQY